MVETNKQTNETVAVENGQPRRLRVRETENKSVDNQEMSPKRQSKTPRKVLNGKSDRIIIKFLWEFCSLDE